MLESARRTFSSAELMAALVARFAISRTLSMMIFSTQTIWNRERGSALFAQGGDDLSMPIS